VVPAHAHDDVILVVDNSGSMKDELTAVENNINDNFAAILGESGVGGTAACPAPEPVFADRFFQYSIKIESDDSFDRILEVTDDNEDTSVESFLPIQTELCTSPTNEVVLAGAAVKAKVACDFAIPTPGDGLELDLDKVAVSRKAANGTPGPRYGQAATSEDCQADAFYIEAEHIRLCPEACAQLQADPGGGVDVLFTCESTIIVK
jgi:hypothetical protein